MSLEASYDYVIGKLESSLAGPLPQTKTDGQNAKMLSIIIWQKFI
jgi:hypothetical protein